MSLNENITNQPQDLEALEHTSVYLSLKTWHPKSYMFRHQKTCKARVKAINYCREQVLRSLHCTLMVVVPIFSEGKNANIAKEKNKHEATEIYMHKIRMGAKEKQLHDY